MQHRRRRSAVGMALAALVAGTGWLIASAGGDDAASADLAGATPPTTAVAALAVDAGGAPVAAPDGWGAHRAAPGTYELTFAADVAVDVRSWEAPATVTVRPVGEHQWTVLFVGADGAPVDTAFSFRAAPTP